MVILSAQSPTYAPLGGITMPLWQEYCDRHGYRFEPEYDADAPNPWRKIERLYQYVSAGEDCMWVGCDTLPTNLRCPVSQVLESDAAEVFLASDVYGINADMIVLRAGVWSQSFLYAVKTIGHSFYGGHAWAEQEAMGRFAHQQPYQPWVSVTAQSVMNSYLHAEYGRPSDWPGNWEPGAWILHLPGLPLERRVALAREYAGKVVR